MVQRNLTPGGDKNGADINLALDALEMAFTHSHINTFVIVGGDSDFMALVEKLKQYDRKVLVVGGRAFTSHILQKNCHEFIAYENLIGRRPGARGRAAAGDAARRRGDAGAPRAQGARGSRGLAAARRAQEHAAAARSDVLGARVRRRHVPRPRAAARPRRLRRAQGHRPQHLRRAARRLRRRAAPPASRDGELREPAIGEHRWRQPSSTAVDRRRRLRCAPAAPSGRAAATAPPPPSRALRRQRAVADAQDATPAAHLAGKQADGYRADRGRVPAPAASSSRWPLYLRQVKQMLRTADESFDERRYGFSGLVEALRYCQREGLFRLDRDRQGVLRVYPGREAAADAPATPATAPPTTAGGEPQTSRSEPGAEPRAGELFDAATARAAEAAEATAGEAAMVEAVDRRRRRTRSR